MRDGLEGSCRKLWNRNGLSGLRHVPDNEGKVIHLESQMK